ncbi:MAG: ROK family protein [Microlunatus sp.]
MLTELWATAAGDTVTANELMARTGLTRATVLGVLGDLVHMGWLREECGSSVAMTTGRPPRRFSFCADAGYVVGVDVGDASIRAAVADLRGRIVGRARRRAGFSESQRAERAEAIRGVIGSALAEADVDADRVRVVSFGLAAPVRPSGGTPAPVHGDYWSRMRLDPGQVLDGWQTWPVLVNNDANLAALAAGAHGEADPNGDYVVLLSGERFGAGVVSGGRLLLGRDGAAGDLHFLELLTGVESHKGLAAIARRLWTTTPEAASAYAVFEAARNGDLAAAAAVRTLADRLARVVAALASLLNPERVIVAGAVAASLGQVIEICRERLPEYAQLPPEVTASSLGGDIVLLGAIQAGITDIASAALDRPPRSQDQLPGLTVRQSNVG